MSSGSTGVERQCGDMKVMGSSWNGGCLYLLFNKFTNLPNKL
jgi:hypothetical protein